MSIYPIGIYASVFTKEVQGVVVGLDGTVQFQYGGYYQNVLVHVRYRGL